MGDLEDLFEPGPENESSPWRLRARAYAVTDIIGAAAGISLYALVGIDSVVSWPSNQVLLSDPDLSTITGVLLVPTWVWLIFSVGMASGRTQSWRLSQLPARPRICFAAAAVVCAAVVAGGFVLGAAKGSARILPGPRYQVSTIDLNQSAWTTVPLRQFHLWQASFVREDGPLMGFRAFAATGFIALLHLHREATRASFVAAVSPELRRELRAIRRDSRSAKPGKTLKHPRLGLFHDHGQKWAVFGPNWPRS